MYEQGYISQATAERRSSDGLGLERGYRYETRQQQYFFDFVQQELIDRYGVATAREGAPAVYTTLEPRLQAAAQQAIVDQNDTAGAAAALVSTDAETGEILAMASSEAYESSQFNLAAQGLRQPGSAFKPFVLTAAVDQGMDPDSTYYPAPRSITLDAATARPGRSPAAAAADEPAPGDRELGQHRLRPARSRRRPRELHRDGRPDGDRDPLGGYPPRRSAA